MKQESSISVGPFHVADISYDDVVSRIRQAVLTIRVPWIAADLHVSSLLYVRRDAYVQALGECDLVYADGVSIALLAHLAGARRLERAPLTDMAHDVLRDMPDPTTCRVALIGGPRDLATRAGEALHALHGVNVVLATHGYHGDWTHTLEMLKELRPAIVFVGMGIPLELEWLLLHRNRLPPAAYLTCGGWFGHVSGEESRAPRWMRHAGLEWSWRMLQQPQRLGPRYVKGFLAFVRLAVQTVIARFKH